MAAPGRATLSPLPGLDSAVTVDVARRWRLVPRGAPVGDTLATIAGEPWAVAGDGWVLVASPLDPAWSALPVRAAFAPWLGALVAGRLQAGGAATRAAPGAPLVAPAGADALRAPDGRLVGVAAAPLSAPPAVGVYLWLRSGAPVGALVVDAEPEETRLARTSEAGLRARVRGGAVVTARDGAAAADAVIVGGGRRPIGGLLAGATLLLLAAEGVATRARRRDPGAAGAPARAAA